MLLYGTTRVILENYIKNSTFISHHFHVLLMTFKLKILEIIILVNVSDQIFFVFLVHGYQDLVLRLDILRKLDKHRGCVNTVSFNAAGDILVSGSDDRRIILWDWETGEIKLSFHSGHHNNVFQAKIMPYTDDRSIVTCAADGQVISLSCFFLFFSLKD